MDAPYYNPQLRQRSRFTLLIYLTGGKGKNVLQFEEGTALQEIGEMSIILFDQALMHSGGAFDKGDKLFLRSELIFQMSEREAGLSDANIGALFSRAVYLTKEGVVGRNVLGEWEHDHYDAVAAAHFGKKPKNPVKPVFFHKRFDGNHFLSNGYDYFFHGKSSNWDLQRCATVLLLDYFNAKYDSTPFSSLCKSSTVTLKRDMLEDIFAHLDQQEYVGDQQASVFKPWSAAQKADLIAPFPKLRQKTYRSDEEDDKVHEFSEEQCCCPFHCFGDEEEEFAEDDGLVGTLPSAARLSTCSILAKSLSTLCC